MEVKYTFIKKSILWGTEGINATAVTYVLCDEAM